MHVTTIVLVMMAFPWAPGWPGFLGSERQTPRGRSRTDASVSGSSGPAGSSLPSGWLRAAVTPRRWSLQPGPGEVHAGAGQPRLCACPGDGPCGWVGRHLWAPSPSPAFLESPGPAHPAARAQFLALRGGCRCQSWLCGAKAATPAELPGVPVSPGTLSGSAPPLGGLWWLAGEVGSFPSRFLPGVPLPPHPHSAVTGNLSLGLRTGDQCASTNEGPGPAPPLRCVQDCPWRPAGAPGQTGP